jgi:hypothetical protein
MIRAARLVPSRPMYAFEPSTFGAGYDAKFRGVRVLRAVWFRRKKGKLVASMGSYELSAYWQRIEEAPPNTYEAWVAQHTDNSCGGEHLASWDGTALLCTDQPVSPEVMAERIAFLDAMLRGFPDPPAGFDGWYEVAKEGADG